MYEFGWHLGPAPLPPYLCSYSVPINLKNTSSFALGCVRNSPSTAKARSRGTIGEVEPVNHPALAPPRPCHRGTSAHTMRYLAEGETSTALPDPLPMHPQGCPGTASSPSSPAGKPSTTGLWESFSGAPLDLRGMGRIMGCRQDHLGMALITEQVQEMSIKG